MAEPGKEKDIKNIKSRKKTTGLSGPTSGRVATEKEKGSLTLAGSIPSRGLTRNKTTNMEGRRFGIAHI